MADARLQLRYGITSTEVANLLEAQGGRCGICGQGLTIGNKNLHVDHDHDTKEVRGVLCRQCNQGIGLFAEDIVRMENAIAYLKEFL